MRLDVYLNKDKETIYTSNITHNLTGMAEEAGIYKHLWRPEELHIKKASELIDPLIEGLSKMLREPERFRKFNAPNGCGSYEDFIQFVQEYIIACADNPNSEVETWR